MALSRGEGWELGSGWDIARDCQVSFAGHHLHSSRQRIWLESLWCSVDFVAVIMIIKAN